MALVAVKPSENLVLIEEKQEALLAQLQSNNFTVYNNLWIAIFEKLKAVRKYYSCFRNVQIIFMKKDNPDQLSQNMNGTEDLSSYTSLKLRDLGARCPNHSLDGEIDDIWTISPYIEQIAVICMRWTLWWCKQQTRQGNAKAGHLF